MQAGPRISVIVPTLNEQRYIERTLASVRSYVPAACTLEVIVVDHGSTDQTAEIAASLGATVLVHEGGTIGALRNRGVEVSTGDFLIFLDADVRPTAAWREHLPAVLQALSRTPRMLTGSHPDVGDDPSWLERWWFAPRAGKSGRHIPSGHLITTRTMFDELDGFDESLETGEDYDLSVRALQAGATLAADERLVVVHDGYPRTLRAFVRRELWHGRSDAASVRAVLHSPVALAGTAFLAMHAGLIAALMARSMVGVLVFAAGIGGLCLVLSARAVRVHGALAVLANSAIFYIYLLARGLSAIATPFTTSPYRHRDAR